MPLRYYEGKVETEPVVYVIFWGSNWEKEPGKQLREQYLLKFYESLPTSPFQSILTQYFQPSGGALSYITKHVKVRSLIDSREPAPGSTSGSEVKSDENIRAEVSYAITKEQGKWVRGINSQFVVVPAPGTKYVESFYGGGFCAYHGEITEANVKSTYSFVPDVADEPFYRFCAGYDEHEVTTRITSMLASHEYAESATDPEPEGTPHGWKDQGPYEIGDICIRLNGTNEVNGAWVQGLWADDQNACSLTDEKPLHLLAITEPASNVGEHEATLKATINPERVKATYYFEYGPTTSYGQSVPSSPASAGEGIVNTSVSQTLSGLPLQTTYHYRVVAKNSRGETHYGEDQTVIPTQWVASEPPGPTGTERTELFGVSCPSAGSCTAVGRDQASGYRPYAETLNAGEFSATSLPLPGQGSGRELRSPHDVAVNNEGNLWITDSGHNRLEDLSSFTGEPIRQVGEEGSGPGQFKEPLAIAIGPKGEIWVTDRGNNRIQEFSSEGTPMAQFGSGGSGEGQFSEPQGIAVDASENVWVADYGNHRVQEYSPAEKKIIRTIGKHGTEGGEFHGPTGITVASSGNVWVSDSGNNRVEEFSSTGEYKRQFTTTAPEPQGIAVDGNENVWVADGQNIGRVQEYSPTGSYVTQYGDFYSYYMWGVTIAGNAQYVADSPYNFVEQWVTLEGSAPTHSATYGVAPQAGLSAISCTSPSACLAVGADYLPKAETTLALAERWDGKAWSLQPISPPSGSQPTVFSGVSCFSSTECIAVGATTNSSGTTVPYAALWKDGQWSEQQMPAVSEGGAITELFSISCTSATACMAVGRTRGEPGVVASGREFAEQLSGSTWSVISPSSPEGTQKAELTSVSCTASNACTAAGSSLAPHPPVNQVYWGSVIWRWNGSGWSMQQSNPTPSGFQGGVSSVSCTSAESCTAAGGYEVQVGHWVALVETWNGESWRVQHTTSENYPENGETRPSGISCVFRSGCALVGLNILEGVQRQLVETSTEREPAYDSTIGTPGSGEGQLSGPHGVAVDSQHNLWVCDYQNNRVEEFDERGKYKGQFNGISNGNGQLKGPTDVAIARNNNLWVTDAGNARVEEFTPSGAYITELHSQSGGKAELTEPQGVTIAPNGDIWVADFGGGRVEQFHENGEFVREVGKLGSPVGVTVDGEKHVWVTDYAGNRVVELSESGEQLSQFGEAGSGNGQLSGPEDISVDASGNLWVVDSQNGRVEEFTRKGEYITKFGGLYYPYGFDIVGGWAYVSNSGPSGVQRWTVAE